MTSRADPTPGPARRLLTAALLVWAFAIVLLAFARPLPVVVDRPEPTGNTIRVNTASAARLTLLPRVGPSIADNIIRSRTTDGPFTNHSDLERVPMIGSIVVQRLSPWVSFDHPELNKLP